MSDVTAPIEHVLVGRGYAEVTRACEVRGDGRVVVGGVTLGLDDASLRVEAEGATVVSARVAIVAARGAAAGSGSTDAQHRRAVDAARGELDARRARVTATEGAIARWRSVGVPARPEGAEGAPPPTAPVAARLELTRLVRERLATLGGRLVVERRDLERAELRLLDAERARERASTDRPARPDELEKAFVIELAGVQDAARLVVRYRVSGARWMPAYTLRLASDGASSLEVRALVEQRTGEDWSGARLSLSSAAPLGAVDAPELTSLRVGRAQRPARRAFREAPVGAQALYDDYDRAVRMLAPAPPAAPAPAAPREASDEGFTRAAATDPELTATLAGYGGAVDALEDAKLSAPPAGAPAKRMKAALAAPQMSMSVPAARGGLFAARGRAAPMEPTTRSEGDFFAAILDDAGGGPPAQAVDLDAQAFAASYGSLRMRACGDARRGELLAVDDATIAVEVTAIAHVAIRFDAARVASALHAARARAAALDVAPAPPRYRLAEAHEGFDFAWTTEAPVDVPSDGAGHTIAVSSAAARVEIAHVAVPRETRDVFRCANVLNPLDAPLLAGPLDVYEDGAFLLATDLPTTAPRGKVTVGLGVDAAVKIARNTQFSELATGLLKGGLELRHGVTVDVANPRALALRIDVRERLPTLRDKEEDIEIDVVRVSPRWEPWEPDDGAASPVRGGHVWRVDVPAGGSKRLEIEYVVRIASKHELVGGNRRES